MLEDCQWHDKDLLIPNFTKDWVTGVKINFHFSIDV